MSPEHARLAILLQEASERLGSNAALAERIGITATEVGDLINSNRFLTKTQAVKIEKALGIPARELWVEKAGAEFDEWLAKRNAK